MAVNERLLQFIWKYKLWDTGKSLVTTEGEPITVVNTGSLNQHAGPDFINARIRIRDTVWAGAIELHVKSSDWNKHKHQNDPNYTKLILHVVYEYDKPIQTLDGSYFPTLALAPFIRESQRQHYTAFLQDKHPFSCHSFITSLSTLILYQQYDRVLTERLESKIQHIQRLLHQSNFHWDSVCYQLMARGFGLHINQDTFEKLARTTPLQLLQKLRDQPFTIEAILFGQAGMLAKEYEDPYPQKLQVIYKHVQSLHHLEPLELHEWKLLRLRPPSFPSLRIAQFSAWILQHPQPMTVLLEAGGITALRYLWKLDVSEYWREHFMFEKKSNGLHGKMSLAFIDTLIINVVVPLLFVYGKIIGKEIYCERALDLLYQLKPEINHVTRQMKSAGFVMRHAGDTQAMLQLKKEYCHQHRCLDCSIGYSIMKKSPLP